MGEENAYLGIDLIDLLDRELDVASVNGIPHLDTLLDLLRIKLRVEIGLLCKFGSGSRVSLIYQVIHDNKVDITKASQYTADMPVV